MNKNVKKALIVAAPSIILGIMGIIKLSGVGFANSLWYMSVIACLACYVCAISAIDIMRVRSSIYPSSVIGLVGFSNGFVCGISNPEIDQTYYAIWTHKYGVAVYDGRKIRVIAGDWFEDIDIEELNVR
jgi:hypothetical protein